MFLIVAGAVTLIVWAYVIFIREWMDAHLQGTGYAWWHEQVEDKLWAQSRTILSARLYWVGGVVIAIHDLAAQAGLDWTPFMTELGNIVPSKWRGLAVAGCLILTGLGFEWLRRVTTSALGQKS